MLANPRHRSSLLSLALSLAAGALLLLPSPARAGEREAMILGRAFAYDYNLKSRAGDSLVLGVLFNPQDSSSQAAAETWFKSFKALAGVKIQGLPLKVVRVPFSNAGALHSSIQAQGIDILFVCDGLESQLGAIHGLSHAEKLLTVAATQPMVEQGLALGVFDAGGKVEIVVNLPAAAQEGVSFSSDLLRLARIIR
jgi:hypothetical protein